MKKSAAIAVIIILLIAASLWLFVYREKKTTTSGQETVLHNISKYSDDFNQSLLNMLDVYYQLTEGFVNWDTSAVSKYSTELKTALDSLQIEELKKDSLVYQKAISGIKFIKTEAGTIITHPTIDEKRVALNNMSQALFEYLNAIHFDAAKIYFQECPMAFNDVNSGYWLSSSEAVRNPYLGTKHPKYKSGMLKCGAPKSSLNDIQ